MGDYSIFIQMGGWEPCSTFDGSGFGAATCNDCWTKVRGPKRLIRLMSTDVDCCNVLRHLSRVFRGLHQQPQSGGDFASTKWASLDIKQHTAGTQRILLSDWFPQGHWCCP